MTINTSISTDPNNFVNYFIEAYKSVKITDNLKTKYANFYENTRLNQLCADNYPEEGLNQIKPSITYTEVDECKENGQIALSSNGQVILISIIFLALSIFTH